MKNDNKIYNSKSIQHAYIRAPKIPEDRIVTLGFVIEVTDDNNEASKKLYLVKVQGEEIQNQAPIADAGIDQIVNSGAFFSLNGSGSSDVEDDEEKLSYNWSQSDNSGYQLGFNDYTIVNPTVKAPSVSNTTILMFQLLVKDTSGVESSDTVTIKVQPQVVVNGAGFDFPLGDRGVSNGAPIAFAEQINSEVNHVYFTGNNITDDFSRLATGADTSQWRNAQDVGNFKSNYGIHPGEDWNLGGGNDDAGEAVYAVADGKVVAIRSSFQSNINAGAWTIVIEHVLEDSSKIYSLYTHLTSTEQNTGNIVASENDFALSVGDSVTRGYFIGRLATNMTKISTSHLHFEMRNIAPSLTSSLWPSGNSVGYYSHDGSKPTCDPTSLPCMNANQIATAYNTMATSVGIIDPSDFIDFNRAGITASVNAISPQSATAGQPTTFTITGTDIPTTIVMSLHGASSCSAAYDVSTTSAKIDCTPGATLGNAPFYAKNKSGGIFLKNSQGLTVEITQAGSELEVLGITFTDLAFAQCVQAKVIESGATDLNQLTTLNCSNKGVSNVDELMYMTGLVTLNLENNDITTINLDNSPDLNAVGLRNNPLNQATKDYLASITWIPQLNYDDTLPVITSKLNDTGITTCSDASTNGLPCPVSGFEGQDGEFGRDVTHNDDSDGHAGFSFTKLDANGNDLAASASEWSCVRDNVTGFIWEVKTNDGGLRDKDNSYTWYNSTGINDDGNAGTQNGGSCPDGNNCDTEKYVQAVNATNLCGANDWRLPAVEGLRSIVDYSRYNPAIDVNFFPNTSSTWFWSSSPTASGSNDAWLVHFNNGYGSAHYGLSSQAVRLVRGGQ